MGLEELAEEVNVVRTGKEVGVLALLHANKGGGASTET